MVINCKTSVPSLFGCCYEVGLSVSLRTHVLISTVLRLVLVYYGELYDAKSEVPYTDVDYKVVTDGARQILLGRSPFIRHTYRYSPLLAYIQLLNLLIHPTVGKIIYASFDMFIALLIYILVRGELQLQCRKAVQSLLSKFGKSRASSKYNETDERNRPEQFARYSACVWLYNPFTAVISTRGNGDSFSSFFVILTIYLLTKSKNTKHGCNWLIFAAGLVHGFAIHLRLYPLVFSLAYFLCLSDSLTSSIRNFLQQILFPTYKQLLLILGTASSLFTFTCFFYWLYGWEYLYETHLYHFVRKDMRHNFSFYFLMQYLSGSAAKGVLVEKVLIVAPQFFLLLYLSVYFGQFLQTLPFCIFSLTFIMVTYNSVVTSQYFVWYLALLPLCVNNLQSISVYKAISFFGLWLLAQALWLLPAFLLEFKTRNTFYWIGAQGILLFLVNSFLLTSFIQHYSFTSFKVNFKKLL